MSTPEQRARLVHRHHDRSLAELDRLVDAVEDWAGPRSGATEAIHDLRAELQAWLDTHAPNES